MKKDIKLQWGFILSIISFALSVVTMIIFFIKVTPNSVVDISTFIGAIAAFIGISVTLIIGFQIYSIIDIKGKMADIDSLKDKIILTNKDLIATQATLSLLETKLNGQILYAEATGKSDQNKHADAFRQLHNAIVYFADLDSEKENLSDYVKLLGAYADAITKDDFKNDLLVQYFIVMNRDSHFKLSERAYYWVIKDEYENIYKGIMQKVGSYIDE